MACRECLDLALELEQARRECEQYREAGAILFQTTLEGLAGKRITLVEAIASVDELAADLEDHRLLEVAEESESGNAELG